MGYRSRSATPGTILCLAATILLAIVSFNTPLLKSLYFLQATYSTGDYAGTLNLGTLGYCLTNSGVTTCVGPTVGYEFNPNTLLGVTVFDIPETITKYLTYTLILHLIALGFAAAATILGLLSHISTLSLLCFPTCTASLASTFSLLALVFDLVIFYIAKTRIDAVSGASASIGISVWLVLAAWLLAGLSGCAYGIGRCCVGARRNQSSGDPNPSKYSRQNSENPDEMRLHALRDEQLRKKEQGLPSFQELERAPLTGMADGEDKYLYEEQADHRGMPGGLRRDGSVLQNVGVGYGRRKPRDQIGAGAAAAAGAYGVGGVPGGWNGVNNGYGYNNAGSGANLSRRMSATTDAGDFVGVGAGGQGVEQPIPPLPVAGGYYGNEGGYGQENGQGYGSEGHGYNSDTQHGYYQDPYDEYHNANQQNGYQDPYTRSQSQPQIQDTYQNYLPNSTSGNQLSIPTPAPTGYNPTSIRPISTDPYNDSHLNGNRVSNGDPYDGYDDGLGAIGMAAASGAGQHERDYTGATFGNTSTYPPGQPPTLHTPTPQHLVNPNHALLRSPMSPSSDVSNARDNIVGSLGQGQGQGQGHGRGVYGNDDMEEEAQRGPRPPSYGAVAGVGGGGGGGGSGYNSNEKSGYR